MYSGNAPSSYAPGGYDQQHFQTFGVQIEPTGDVYSQPPSQGDMGHNQGDSLNQFQAAATYRGLGQPTVIDDNSKAPSLTDLNHGQRVSNNHDLNISRESVGSYYGHSAAGQAPSASAMTRLNVSNPYGTQMESYSKDGKAPDRSDVDRRGLSETGPSSTIKLDDPDAQDLVGISLVGKNFRKFYPNAYYRDEDEEN